MGSPIAGHAGSGTVTAYTLGALESWSLDTITFEVATDGTAGFRMVEVAAFTPDDLLIFRVPDWNDLPASSTVTYTFGQGLSPFSCTLATGLSVQNDLPLTTLEPECRIVLRSVDSSGAVVAGDAFSAVVLWVSDSGLLGADTGAIPPYTPLPSTAPAAA